MTRTPMLHEPTFADLNRMYDETFILIRASNRNIDEQNAAIDKLIKLNAAMIETIRARGEG